MWQLPPQTMCQSIKGGTSFNDDEVIIKIVFHPTEDFYAVLSNRSLRLRTRQSFGPNREDLDRKNSMIGDLSFSPDGTLLAVATLHGLELWKFPSLEMVAIDESIAATSVDFSDTNCTLAVGDTNGVVRLYDLE